jgi:hypothetical protein
MEPHFPNTARPHYLTNDEGLCGTITPPFSHDARGLYRKPRGAENTLAYVTPHPPCPSPFPHAEHV